MAVAFDAASSAENVGTATSLTWSHTCAANASLGVGVAVADASLTPTATYNGVAMTLEIRRTLPVDGDQVCLFKLEAPASGAHNVVVSYGASVYFVGVGVSVTGADQTDCTSNSNSATGTMPTNAITVDVTSAVGEYCFAMLAGIADADSTAGAGETERGDLHGGASTLSGHGFTETGAATVTFNPTLSINSEWGLVAMSFKAAAGNVISLLGAGSMAMAGRLLERIEAMKNDSRVVIGRA